MTRRAFLARAGTTVGLVVAAAAIILVGMSVSASIFRAGLSPGHALGLGLMALLVVVVLVTSVVPPMLVGAIGPILSGGRPRLAGALAGALGYVPAHALSVAVAANLHATFFNVHRNGWMSHLFPLAWWVFWGSIGGAFLAQWRAGWRGNASRPGLG